MMSCYPKISPMVLFILMTPYSYPMGRDRHSFSTQNDQKLLKNVFLAIFTPITSYSTHNIVFWRQRMVPHYPKISPMVQSTRMTPYTYPMGHHGHSFVTKNGKRIIEKHVFGDFYLHDLLIYP